MGNLPGADLVGISSTRISLFPSISIAQASSASSCPSLSPGLAGDPAHLEAACHQPELQVLDVQQLHAQGQPRLTSHFVHSLLPGVCRRLPSNHLAPWSPSQPWEAGQGQDTIKEALTGVRNLGASWPCCFWFHTEPGSYPLTIQIQCMPLSCPVVSQGRGLLLV